MRDSLYVYGPVLSRRLGRSIGLSPFKTKICNLDCIYCQLGRTHNLMVEPDETVATNTLLDLFDDWLKTDQNYDTVTVSGLGEPTLYKDLKNLVLGLKARTDKPVALITNGTRFDNQDVFAAALEADIVLPTIFFNNPTLDQTIHRPHAQLNIERCSKSLDAFSNQFTGELWLEVMLIEEINDTDLALEALKKRLQTIRYQRLYINVPIRPGADSTVKPPLAKRVKKFADTVQGLALDALAEGSYQSAVTDDYEALLNIIRVHPLHQHEISAFLKQRKACIDSIFRRLNQDPQVRVSSVKGLRSYRLEI